MLKATLGGTSAIVQMQTSQNPLPQRLAFWAGTFHGVGGEAFSWMEGTRCNHKDADLSETPSIESNMGRVFDGGLFHTWRVTSTIIQVKHSQPPLDSDPVRDGGGIGGGGIVLHMVGMIWVLYAPSPTLGARDSFG